jgi:zinc/manganese transport system ATP-binding protein
MTAPKRIALCASLPFYRYGSSITALTNVSVSFEQGSLTAIVGPNGGGKSTLMKLLAGIYEPQSGQVTRSISVATDIAYLPQHHELDRTFPFLVTDVIAMGLWPNIKTKPEIITQILEEVDLKGFEKRPLSALSGGQFQRLLFARLIAQKAKIILLDEPFVGVDQATLIDLIALIHEWHEQGKTIVAVLHDLTLVRQHFDQTLILSQKVIARGFTQDILTLENLAQATFHV